MIKYDQMSMTFQFDDIIFPFAYLFSYLHYSECMLLSDSRFPCQILLGSLSFWHTVSAALIFQIITYSHHSHKLFSSGSAKMSLSATPAHCHDLWQSPGTGRCHFHLASCTINQTAGDGVSWRESIPHRLISAPADWFIPFAARALTYDVLMTRGAQRLQDKAPLCAPLVLLPSPIASL